MILPEDDIRVRRRALNSGADDFFIGPVSRAAPLERVRSEQFILANASVQPNVKVGDLSFDIPTRQAFFRGQLIELSHQDFRLLLHLAEHSGRIFTRSQLIAALGRQGYPVAEQSVRYWIARLREALRDAGAGDLLRTVRHIGYGLDRP